MLLLRLFLLVPTIVALVREKDLGAYVIKMTKDHKLKAVEFTGELNLSNLGLASLEKNVFPLNLWNVRRLTLANNSLSTIPESLFSNLINLEYLSLADNEISSFLENVFSGLENLQVLDIANNKLTELSSNYFLGLTSSTNIIIQGNLISYMSTDIFKGTIPENNQLSEDREVAIRTHDDTTVKNYFHYKVCYDKHEFHHGNKVIKIVDRLRTSELPPNCEEVPVIYIQKKLSIHKSAILVPEINCTGLQDLPISSLDFSFNKLPNQKTIISILNNLPANIKNVDLSNNDIINEQSLSDIKETIMSIENKNLHSLNLAFVQLHYVGPSLLNKTKLRRLDLTATELRDLNFVKFLPSTLREIDLSGNHINDIPAESFVGLRQLVRLSLSGNNIVKLGSHSLRGLFSLQFLYLSSMRPEMKTIESGCFRDLKKLRLLDLNYNRINIYKGLFTGLESIEVLDLAGNELSNITGDTLYALPDTLSKVNLDQNNIQRLENNSFVRVPKHTLSLIGNKINFIASGCFNLPTLNTLRLTGNKLREFSSWGNLEGLKDLWLDLNQITTIKKGATKNMERLEFLDLSANNFSELENGALCGLSKQQSYVHLNEVPIQLIQGGVFDDVRP